LAGRIARALAAKEGKGWERAEAPLRIWHLMVTIVAGILVYAIMAGMAWQRFIDTEKDVLEMKTQYANQDKQYNALVNTLNTRIEKMAVDLEWIKERLKGN
jgi:Tfp pilus assembly protein PilO